MSVRPATEDDAAGVHELEVGCFGAEAWSATSVREELTAAGRRAVVEFEGDQLVGYAVATVAADPQDPVDLLRIAVHPERRRRGTAHRLLAEVLGPRTLLEVSARNGAALALYAAEGFVEVARRQRYYRDGSDAVVMQRVAAGGHPQADPPGSATIEPAGGDRAGEDTT